MHECDNHFDYQSVLFSLTTSQFSLKDENDTTKGNTCQFFSHMNYIYFQLMLKQTIYLIKI